MKSKSQEWSKLNWLLNFPSLVSVRCRSMCPSSSLLCHVRPFSVNFVDWSPVDKTIPPFHSNPVQPLDYFDVNLPPTSKYYSCPSIYSMEFYSSWWFSFWFLVQASLVVAIACRDQPFRVFLAVVSLIEWKNEKWNHKRCVTSVSMKEERGFLSDIEAATRARRSFSLKVFT